MSRSLVLSFLMLVGSPVLILMGSSILTENLAQAQQAPALTESQIAQRLQRLQEQVVAESSNVRRVELIAREKTLIEARIIEVAMDAKIPYKTVARHYRMGDQLIVLGMLKAKDASSMTAESCQKARNQVSLSGYNPDEGDERVIPKHLVSVSRTLDIICK